jgi:hypothetical protein
MKLLAAGEDFLGGEIFHLCGKAFIQFYEYFLSLV